MFFFLSCKYSKSNGNDFVMKGGVHVPTVNLGCRQINQNVCIHAQGEPSSHGQQNCIVD